MNYLKISELANRCEVKHQQIIEHYRMIGSHPNLDSDTKEVFYAAILDMKVELEKLENQLRKLIKKEKGE